MELVVRKIKYLKTYGIKKKQRNKAEDSGIILYSIDASLPFTSKVYWRICHSMHTTEIPILT